eukprot:GHVU01209412.1.p1 GENE.GHVU01209412.1~~GHVU01209412.1.p1  ORF type:complete len:137 (-),score=6.24 GHVU01209412.1:258-668(-)
MDGCAGEGSAEDVSAFQLKSSHLYSYSRSTDRVDSVGSASGVSLNRVCQAGCSLSRAYLFNDIFRDPVPVLPPPLFPFDCCFSRCPQPMVDRILIPRGLLQDRMEKLAFDIYNKYQGKELHVVCILKVAAFLSVVS